jgi:transposase
MAKTFRAWEIDQVEMFPPTVRDFVPEGHVAHLLRDLVREELDLSEVEGEYGEERGQPPYAPGLMVALLLYAYSRGVYSSRAIERACEERVDFMAVTGRSKPDHDTICDFRRRHREALARLFVQVLELCRDAGLTKLGHVALDGTKVKANASKHRAMSYKRMKEREPELAAEVERWLKAAQRADEAEDAEHGKGNRGDEIPDHVRAKIRQLARMRASMERIEAEAKAKAAREAAEREAKAKEQDRPPRGRPPSAEPEPKAQSNFTDPDSRIMKTSGGFEQAYNCQLAVDAESQVIVACEVVARQNDGEQLVGMADQIEANLGKWPAQLSADANYCSEANLEALEERGIEPYLATGRQKHGDSSPTSNEKAMQGPRASAMREKLRAEGHASPYRLRKQSVEPVAGQIKEARGFRRFLLRGIAKVRTEWALVCTAHNVLKLAAARAAVR